MNLHVIRRSVENHKLNMDPNIEDTIQKNKQGQNDNINTNMQMVKGKEIKDIHTYSRANKLNELRKDSVLDKNRVNNDNQMDKIIKEIIQ